MFVLVHLGIVLEDILLNLGMQFYIEVNFLIHSRIAEPRSGYLVVRLRFAVYASYSVYLSVFVLYTCIHINLGCKCNG